MTTVRPPVTPPPTGSPWTIPRLTAAGPPSQVLVAVTWIPVLGALALRFDSALLFVAPTAALLVGVATGLAVDLRRLFTSVSGVVWGVVALVLLSIGWVVLTTQVGAAPPYALAPLVAVAVFGCDWWWVERLRPSAALSGLGLVPLLEHDLAEGLPLALVWFALVVAALWSLRHDAVAALPTPVAFGAAPAAEPAPRSAVLGVLASWVLAAALVALVSTLAFSPRTPSGPDVGARLPLDDPGFRPGQPGPLDPGAAPGGGLDVDGDGLPDLALDLDGDGLPDLDADGDGLPDDPDGLGREGGAGGLAGGDVDGDGVPNAEDGDVDGDGVPNELDSDVDGDGQPDGDVDGDGVADILEGYQAFREGFGPGGSASGGPDGGSAAAGGAGDEPGSGAEGTSSGSDSVDDAVGDVAGIVGLVLRVLLGLVVLVALAGAVWAVRRHLARRRALAARPWPILVAERLEREGARRGRRRGRSEPVTRYVDALAAGVLPDERLAAVGVAVSEGLFGAAPPPPEQGAWAERVLDEATAAHPAPGLRDRLLHR